MLFQKKNRALLAIANGNAIALDQVEDEAFASGMLGVGVAVEPRDGTIYSPVSGRIADVAKTSHAYSIVTEDGADLLVHIGIDTVSLGGKGFLPMVSVGDEVKAGEVLARVDLNILRGGNFPCTVVVLFTDPEQLADWKISTGRVNGGQSKIFEYRLKE